MSSPADSIGATDLLSQDLWAQLEQQAGQAAKEATVSAFKDCLTWGRQALYDGFNSGLTITDLVRARAHLVDRLLVAIWDQHLGNAHGQLALAAAGGYGRSELLPYSDIDLLILRPVDLDEAQKEALQGFLTFLWDIGLEVGHSVRSPADCGIQAADDLTVMTNMLEARLLCGSAALFEEMQTAIDCQHLWPVAAFFHGKLEEQQKRHAKFDDTAYKLEPNVKESPGGLRDIQTIAWVAKRHFDARSLDDLVTHGFLSAQECQELIEAQNFLWRVRFALHMLTDRREDRLLFDHQLKVAKLFGYSDSEHDLAVEQFMQRYYRCIKALSCLNDMLLQLFAEAIVHRDDVSDIQPINRRFQSRHGFIEVVHDQVFAQTPFALLEIFYLMQLDKDLIGIRAETLRLIRRSRALINDDFRADIRARSFFMEMLRNGDGLTRALRRMNRYGLLGRYVPAFGLVIGRMQYDLFHTLTVDEHTLFVVRNLRRMAMQRFSHELPFCSEVMARISKPELLYLAGFFHDIAKGRGGDHSELGATDAREFGLEHGLSGQDSELVAWLVQQHLLMSMTAQRRDISDPQVIHEFATAVGNRRRLDHLYLLTVADIRATNPSLWNSWRENLLTGLYNNCARAFERGLDDPISEHELIGETQEAARTLLLERGMQDIDIDRVWSRIEADYFRRTDADEIAWSTQGIHACSEDALPLILVDSQSQGTAVFVYTRDMDYLFGRITAVLAQLGLTILDARVSATTDGYTLDTYVVLESDGSAIRNAARCEEIRQALQRSLRMSDKDVQPPVRQHVSRVMRHFSVPTQVHFSLDANGNHTVMELVTGDRPGLLSTVGKVFQEHQILLHSAKVGTIGERAEDVFTITDRKHQPIQDAALYTQLRQALVRALDHSDGDD